MSRRHRPKPVRLETGAFPTGETVAAQPPAAEPALLRPQEPPPAPPAQLPPQPYRSLAQYERMHRPLFAGRDQDVRCFADLIDAPTTRILVLQGDSGVGKSSFLKAGVIPFLEDECQGYRFLHDRSEQEPEPGEGREQRTLFVRATDDPTRPLAEDLLKFCARPLGSPRPVGKRRPLELGLLLAEQLAAEKGPARDLPTAEGLRNALAEDPTLLGRILGALGDKLPYAPVLVIDQFEEIFTQGQVSEEPPAALEMLRLAAGVASNFKVIVSLRTEFYGRLIGLLHRTGPSAPSIKDYFLTGLGRDQLIEVITRPTIKDRLPGTTKTPREEYHFHYEDGVPERIVDTILEVARQQRANPLPLIQIVCSQLYDLRDPADQDFVITGEHLKTYLERIGGAEQSLQVYVEAQVGRLFATTPRWSPFSQLHRYFLDFFPRKTDQDAFKRLFKGLYLRHNGTLSTARRPIQELEKEWQGTTPFKEVLKKAAQSLLLRVSPPGSRRGQEFVSLGHDALALVAEAWDKQLAQEEVLAGRRRRLVFYFFLVYAVSILVVVFAYRWQGGVARKEAAKAAALAEEAGMKARETRQFLYAARMSGASSAWERRDIERLRELLGDFRLGGEADFRGFEWYYWWGRCYGDRATLRGPGGRVTTVAFSPDRRLLAAAGGDGGVRLWDARSGEQLPGPAPGAWPVLSVAFSPDSKKLALGRVRVDKMAGVAAEVRLWDVAARKELLVLADNPEVSAVLAFSPDGRTLAVGGGGHWDARQEKYTSGAVKLWDLASGKKRTTLRAEGARVTAVAFSPDGKTLAASTRDTRVRLWDVERAVERRTLRVSAPPPGSNESSIRALVEWIVRGAELDEELFSVAYSPAGDKIAACGARGYVYVWTVADGSLVRFLRGPSGPAYAVAFSPDGSTLAAAADDKTVPLWDVATGELRSVLGGHTGPVLSAAFFPDGRTLASGSHDGTVKLWDIDPSLREEINFFSDKLASVFTIAVSPDRRWLASGHYDGTITVWKALGPRALFTLKPAAEGAGGGEDQGAKGTVSCLAFSADSKALAAGNFNHRVSLWNLERREQTGWHAKHNGPVLAVAVSPDGRRVASGGADNTVKLWDPKADTVESLSGHTGLVNSVSFSPDGRTLASGSQDFTVRLWDVGGGRECQTLWEHTDAVNAVTFSPDGRILASASNDRTVKMWEVSTRKVLHSARNHEGPVKALAFAPDGRRLASGSDDQTVKLWDVQSGHEVSTLDANRGWVNALTFSADGSRLVATSGRTVIVWRRASDAQVAARRE